MGRHSARDDDGVVMTFSAPVAGAPPRRGRHAQHDDLNGVTEPLAMPGARNGFAEQDTIRLVPPEPPPPPEPPAAVPAEAAVAPPKAGSAPDQAPQQAPTAAVPRPAARGHHSTAADLALLRRHSDVRARVIAAAVVPFVLYTVVIYLLTAFDVYFIWVWIPLVSAGVLAGSFLDAAHRRLGRQR